MSELPEFAPIAPQPKGIGCFADAAGRARFAAAYRAGMTRLPPVDATRVVETSFGSVTAYRFGPPAAEPILLLSGRRASTPMWAANIASLRRIGTVWSMDSIGEPGASAQTRAITDPRDQATWLDEAIGQLDCERAHLLAVSIGGWLATQCLLHRPDRIASATLLDPAMTFAPISWKMIVVSLGSVLPGMPQALRHRLLGWLSGGVPVDDSIPEARLIASGMRDFRQHLPFPRPPAPDRLAAITTPLLVILAGASIVHDPARAAERARLVPDAQVEVWPGRSHAINGEAPEEITARVGEFLSGL
ncbi:alpha/beta hydrolase [Nocardia panacis]|uniref:Alpha/beta hydrolase n=1 Tax=Nocardia panacis TaxID=2340916 RepID=A0A3A4K1Q9_9NOCA|nr:alpha/beta hydrolase [Nocardia panacis]RJO78368.1 alpha/beta hydrolase [Nocardia panacis]